MSRTIRLRVRYNLHDGEAVNVSKDKKPRKRFMLSGDGYTCKARGGVGNKRGWKSGIPKWIYKILKEKAR